MYEGVVMSVRTIFRETGEFSVTIGPYLFALIMDEVTAHIQEEVPLCMLFAYDIVLVDKSRDGVNPILKRWREEALESKGIKISGTKTEYMVCKFSGDAVRSLSKTGTRKP